jgi:cell shape-determining protein MreD
VVRDARCVPLATCHPPLVTLQQMNWLSTTLIFFVTWLVVFASTQFAPVSSLIGAPLTLVPAVLVYVALTNHLAVTTALSVFSALGLDALSANRLGVSLLPMFAAAFLIQTRRHVILREQTYAQFWLGAGAGLFIPLATLAILSLGQRQPIVGWPTVWQWLVIALANGLLCPAAFRLFDALRRTFDYQPVVESSFRPDRQIKRGRL